MPCFEVDYLCVISFYLVCTLAHHIHKCTMKNWVCPLELIIPILSDVMFVMSFNSVRLIGFVIARGTHTTSYVGISEIVILITKWYIQLTQLIN